MPVALISPEHIVSVFYHSAVLCHCVLNPHILCPEYSLHPQTQHTCFLNSPELLFFITLVLSFWNTLSPPYPAWVAWISSILTYTLYFFVSISCLAKPQCWIHDMMYYIFYDFLDRKTQICLNLMFLAHNLGSPQYLV